MHTSSPSHWPQTEAFRWHLFIHSEKSNPLQRNAKLHAAWLATCMRSKTHVPALELGATGHRSGSVFRVTTKVSSMLGASCGSSAQRPEIARAPCLGPSRVLGFGFVLLAPDSAVLCRLQMASLQHSARSAARLRSSDMLCSCRASVFGWRAPRQW